MNVLQDRFQHSTALLHLRCVYGFTVILLKEVFVLCLKDEEADSIRLLGPRVWW